MTPEQKLTALWNEAAPPARDPAFTIAAMQRVERRRMWGQILELAPFVVVMGAVAWALAPAMENLFAAGLEEIGQVATAETMVAVSLIAGLWLILVSFRPAIERFK